VIIGDHDPEDSWDDGDPVEDRLAILERVAAAEPRQARRVDALRLVAKLERVALTRGQSLRVAAVRAALEGAGDG
jgi:hypothetical protein